MRHCENIIILAPDKRNLFSPQKPKSQKKCSPSCRLSLAVDSLSRFSSAVLLSCLLLNPTGSKAKHWRRTGFKDTTMAHQHMRALFTYDSRDDEEHPDPENGLSFTIGDILSIENETSDDGKFTMASIVSRGTLGAPSAEPPRLRNRGLVPSKIWQERRVVNREEDEARRNAASTAHARGASTGCCPFKLGRSSTVERSASEVLTMPQRVLKVYEPVALLPPSESRILVLLAAKGTGRSHLILHLLLNFPERFAHPREDAAYLVQRRSSTTRTPRSGQQQTAAVATKRELRAEGYHMVPLADFRRKRDCGRYLEYEEHCGVAYGLTLNSVRRCMATRKTTILSVSPSSLARLRTTEFKPFVIFLKAISPVFKLRRLYERVSADVDDDVLIKVIKSSIAIGEEYSYLFDYTMQLTPEIERVAEDVVEVHKRLQAEPQWVPQSWTVE